jgi:hypothetical protein
MKILRPATALAALLASTGCDLIPTEAIEGTLPPLESLLIPKPSERAADNTEEQAVCADGNDVGAAIEARIDGLNASIAADRALLEAIYATEPTGIAGVATYEAEVGGRTLNIQLVTEDDEFIISANIDLAVYISGRYKADASEGAIVITPTDGDPIASTWTTDGGTLNMARVEGEAAVASVFTNDGDKGRLAVTGEAIVSLVAVWGLADGAGAAIEGTDEAGCWSAGDAAADLCTVVCDETLLAALPTLPE